MVDLFIVSSATQVDICQMMKVCLMYVVLFVTSQDSFCVDSDHVEYASSASSHGGSPAKRQRGRRRRIVTISSSEGERSPATRRDASATKRRSSESESDADFQQGRIDANRRSVAPERTHSKLSAEKVKTASSTSGVWLSSKRPAGSVPKSGAKLKRLSDRDDPFEHPTSVGTNKSKRTPPSSDLPVFNLGLFDSDDDAPTAAPLSERKENIVPDAAGRERQARLERARQKQAEFRRRLAGERSSAVTAPGSAGASGGGAAESSSFQSRLSAGNGREGPLNRTPAQVRPAAACNYKTDIRPEAFLTGRYTITWCMLFSETIS